VGLQHSCVGNHSTRESLAWSNVTPADPPSSAVSPWWTPGSPVAISPAGAVAFCVLLLRLDSSATRAYKWRIISEPRARARHVVGSTLARGPGVLPVTFHFSTLLLARPAPSASSSSTARRCLEQSRVRPYHSIAGRRSTHITLRANSYRWVASCRATTTGR
jgi:hypothetical protein